ncbi:MAG: hypothetical protein GX199_06360 [Firmicutes bacterium]|nr:hypothetical protein [Bacillota bacterium]
MVYLKRSLRRRFGSSVSVRLVSPESLEARKNGWVRGNVLPVVIVNGEVFCRGRLSLKEVVQQVQALLQGVVAQPQRR